MSDEMIEQAEQEEYFTYCDELVQEMNELFDRHRELVDEYSRAMEYLRAREWRAGYVLWTDNDGSVEGRDDDGQLGD